MKPPPCAGAFDRPAGERTSDVDHILLGISAIDSQGVELEQLPSVILVQAGALPLLRLLRLLSLPSLLSSECRPVALGHAARIVEIEKHRRTLSDRTEQVAEFSECARPHHVLIEVRQIVRLGRALLRIDAEVIFPEVGHHFLQLPLARYCARNARRLELSNNLSGEVAALLHLLPKRDAVGSGHQPTAVRHLPPHLASLALLLRVLHEQIILVPIDRRIPRHELFDRGVVDLFRAQLLIDPLVEADRANLQRFTRPSSEGQTIQRLDDLLIGGQLTDIGTRYNCLRGILRTGSLPG